MEFNFGVVRDFNCLVVVFEGICLGDVESSPVKPVKTVSPDSQDPPLVLELATDREVMVCWCRHEPCPMEF